MNIVIILKNDKSLSDYQIDTKILKENYSDLIIDTEIFLYNDGFRIGDINERFSTDFINNNEFFIVLHASVHDENVRQELITKYGPNVIRESHLKNGFFLTIIPKLINKTCTFEEIKSFFPDLYLNAKLVLLHKLYGGDFDLSEKEKELIDQQNFQLSDFKNDADWANLRKFRDQLFSQ